MPVLFNVVTTIKHFHDRFYDPFTHCSLFSYLIFAVFSSGTEFFNYSISSSYSATCFSYLTTLIALSTHLSTFCNTYQDFLSPTVSSSSKHFEQILHCAVEVVNTATYAIHLLIFSGSYLFVPSIFVALVANMTFN